jgi:hypothetical protein
MFSEVGIKPPLALMVIALLMLDAVTLALILRWSGHASAWDDLHGWR